jgi:hypothetical protein
MGITDESITAMARLWTTSWGLFVMCVIMFGGLYRGIGQLVARMAATHRLNTPGSLNGPRTVISTTYCHNGFNSTEGLSFFHLTDLFARRPATLCGVTPTGLTFSSTSQMERDEAHSMGATNRIGERICLRHA